jgi:enoyl-CoA hydratase
MAGTTSAPIEIRRDGGVAFVRLARPETHNALTSEVAGALRDALEALSASEDVRCVVIEGSGRSFAAGADIHRIHAQTTGENLAYNAELRAAIEAVASAPVPTIAAVNGHALGGGLELALACSLRVAALTAKLGLPEVRLGILPGAGGIHRLARLVSSGAANKMLLTGAPLAAEEALRIGLVDEVAPPERLERAVLDLARRIAANAPLAVRAVVAALCEDGELELQQASAQAEARLASLLDSDDRHEGMSAFIERRDPRFTGR